MPTLAGFISWIFSVMGVPANALSQSDPVITTAYNLAVEIVNPDIASVSSVMYPQAVYNLAGDILVNLAQDQTIPSATAIPAYENNQAFWAYTRQKFNIYGFVSGVIQSSSDNGTGSSLVVMEAARNFTLANLQNLKTPWGRAYLAIAQSAGTLWGMT